ncbi:MAG TPA: hypothetical protein VLG44_06650 [Chlamydiales bacterium]|nr:hypothetical protein [Chlamydiales bacterium]
MGECCSNEKCCCPCHSKQNESCHSNDQEMEFHSYFLEIADMAWEEVLKDQIKEYILSTQKKRMQELAKIVAEGNNQRWRAKMQNKHSCHEFQEKIHHFFSQTKSEK